MFSELGWLDNSGNWSEAAAQADLATLSPNVTAVLSEDNIQQCMEMVMGEMAEDKIVKKCVVNGKGNYSEEDLAALEELATATAGIQCFLHMFQVRPGRSHWSRDTELSLVGSFMVLLRPSLLCHKGHFLPFSVSFIA